MMNNWHRIVLLLRRFWYARAIGVQFLGTKRFRLPRKFVINNRHFSLIAPQELGLSLDFINLLLDDEYGLRSISSAPQNILDIGANIGLFSLWASASFPSAKIHAYEPNPKILSFTQTNLAQCHNITLFKEAVSSESGFGSIIGDFESQIGQFTKEKSSDIKAITLEEAINRIGGKVDLLKLDCEGSEWEIFQNSTPFKSIRTVRMEYHLIKDYTVDDLKKFITNIGFNIEHIRENAGFGIVWFSHPAT